MLINAAGPWVENVIQNTAHLASGEGLRLVRGSYIVTRRLFDHDKSYFFQGEDGRIIFAIPYESDFTLIGTTDDDHADPDQKPICTQEEADYLREFASRYFKVPLVAKDIVWTYSGVRPLYDDGVSSASAATRDYVLKLDEAEGAPLLNVFGGKITTYRKQAEAALEKLASHFPGLSGPWTAGVTLPGGDFPPDGVEKLVSKPQAEFPFLDHTWARRLVRTHGTQAQEMLGNATCKADLECDFGANLTDREVNWLVDREFARTAEDIAWRRTKLGLRLKLEEIEALDRWLKNHRDLQHA